MVRKRWSNDEIAFLIKAYRDTPTCRLSEILERPHKSIYTKARYLGLIKDGRPGVISRKSKIYNINYNIFDVIDPSLAYVLGFILADGNIQRYFRKNGYVSYVRCNIANTSYYILDKIKNILMTNVPIKIETKGKHSWFVLGISGKDFCAKLIELGILPNKSLISDLPAIDNYLFPDFLRGYFDGDGSSRWNKKSGLIIKFTSGSKKLLERFAIEINKFHDLPLQTIHLDKNRFNAFRLYYYGPCALKLAEIMYKGAGDLFIPYKREPFENYRAWNAFD